MEQGLITWDWSNRFWLALEVLRPEPIPDEVFVLEALFKPRHMVLKGDFSRPSDIASMEQSDDALVWWMLARAGGCRKPKCIMQSLLDASSITGGSIVYVEFEPPIGEGDWLYKSSDAQIPQGWWR